MAAITGFIIASIVASVLAAGASIGGTIYNANQNQAINDANVKAQQDINAANLANQRIINQQNINYSREFAQNGIQWKMNDLQEAGLNPVMAAQGALGGTSSPIASASATQQAAQQKPGFIDMNGVSSAITAMNNTMLTAYLMSERNSIQSGRNDIMSEKNDVLRNLYKRKGIYMDSKTQSALIHNAKEMNTGANTPEWDDILKQLRKLPGGKDAFHRFTR